MTSIAENPGTGGKALLGPPPSEPVVPGGAVERPPPVPGGKSVLPAIIASAGADAVTRFAEYFTAHIRNPRRK